MTKPMSELFKLPLKAQRRCANPHWGMTIVEQGNDDGDMAWSWIMEVNARTERTNGSRTLLVSAQERAEAIVAAVNERDALRAEVVRLREALIRAARCTMEQTPHAPGKIVWQCRLCGSQRDEPHSDECPFAALDAGQGENATD